MAVKKIKVMVGYVGLTPQYHEIYYETPEKIHPKNKQTNFLPAKVRGNMMFASFFRNRKRSYSYEGSGKNFNALKSQ